MSSFHLSFVCIPKATHAYSCLRPPSPLLLAPPPPVLNCAACLMRQLCAKGANGTYDGTY